MTTIIAKNGKLYTDRRKVFNYYRVGIVGADDSTKIQLLPYCAFATNGFDFEDNGTLYKKMERTLNALFSILYFKSPEFKQHPVHGVLSKIPRFKIMINNAAIVLKEKLHNQMIHHRAGILAIDRHHIVSAGQSAHTGGDILNAKTDTVVSGSANMMASILLDNGVPMDEVYKAIRSSGAPTGATVDMFDPNDLPKALFPPVVDNNFIAFLMFEMASYLEKDQGSSTKTKLLYVDDAVRLIRIFTGLGNMSKDGKRVIFSRKDINENFKTRLDINSAHYKDVVKFFIGEEAA